MYCYINKIDIESLCDDYLIHLSSQKIYKCNKHKLLLIYSYQKKLKCALCNENPEYYCCPRFDCDYSICIHCNNSLLNSNDYIYVTSHNQDILINDNSMQSNSDEEDNDLCDNSRDSDCLIDFF